MSNNKRVALTFDDGPNPPYTNQILDILKKGNIKASFFVCGANAKRHPEIVKKIAIEDHLVGNHSYNHGYVPTRLGLIYKETIETQKLIEKLADTSVILRPKAEESRSFTRVYPEYHRRVQDDNKTKPKKYPKLFRAPWGFIPFWLKRKLITDGFKLIGYNDCARDWVNNISAETIAKNVITEIKDGQNILLHDGMNTKEGADRSKTVAALPIIIKTLKSQGYQFAPVII